MSPLAWTLVSFLGVQSPLLHGGRRPEVPPGAVPHGMCCDVEESGFHGVAPPQPLMGDTVGVFKETESALPMTYSDISQSRHGENRPVGKLRSVTDTD